MIVYKELVMKKNTAINLRCFINSSTLYQDNYITVHPHWHNEVEILYMQRGTAFQQINDQTFSISKGDLVIIRNQDIHATYTLQPLDTDILVLQFSANAFDVLGPTVAENIELFSDHTALPYPIKTDTAIGKELFRLVQCICSEYNRSYIDNKSAATHTTDLLLLAYCATLLGLTVKHYYSEKNFTVRYSDKVKKPLQNLFTYIDQHFEQHISLAEAAKVTNFSIPHFSRVFRQAVGMSFVSYLNHYRIQKSISYLKEDKTITEIAGLCGFGSINSYIREFKKKMQLSPERYRKKL